MNILNNDLQRTLEREAKGCQTLIIWTDGDREGENIGFEIIQVCKAGGFLLGLTELEFAFRSLLVAESFKVEDV